MDTSGIALVAVAPLELLAEYSEPVGQLVGQLVVAVVAVVAVVVVVGVDEREQSSSSVAPR